MSKARISGSSSSTSDYDNDHHHRHHHNHDHAEEEEVDEQERLATQHLFQVLTEVEEDNNFDRFIHVMRSKLDVRDRLEVQHSSMVPFFKCFTGRSFVDYVLDNLKLRSRKEAVLIGQRWLNGGVFYHVTRSETFTDGGEDTSSSSAKSTGTHTHTPNGNTSNSSNSNNNIISLYRFQIDEIGSILNMKQARLTSADMYIQSSSELVALLHRSMKQICAQFVVASRHNHLYNHHHHHHHHHYNHYNQYKNNNTSQVKPRYLVDYERLALSNEFKVFIEINR